MQVGKRANAALFVFLAILVFAIVGIGWRLALSENPSMTGRYAATSVKYVPPAFWSQTPVGVAAPAHRTAFQCVCVTPKDAGVCAIANCLDADTAKAFCVAALPPSSSCQVCRPSGTLQKATSNVHVLKTASCTV
jgi:hypothetical protein